MTLYKKQFRQIIFYFNYYFLIFFFHLNTPPNHDDIEEHVHTVQN